MTAYTERQQREAHILAIAFHEPNKLSEQFPKPPRRRIAAAKWW